MIKQNTRGERKNTIGLHLDPFRVANFIVLSLLRASLKTLKNTVKKRKKRGKKKKNKNKIHVGEEKKLEEQGDP